MSDKTLKTRIQHKRGTANDWSQATNFVPLDGELIIYNEKDGTSPKFKVGDGTTLVGNLPFVTSEQSGGGDVSGDYLPLTGGTLTGALSVDTAINIPAAYWLKRDGALIGGLRGYTGSDGSQHRIALQQNASGSTYGEVYYLPAPDVLDTGGASYNILTSKDLVSIAQGGTGATDASTALDNLGGRKIYKSVEALGLTPPVTTYDAYMAMPSHSTLIVQSAEKNQISDVPMNYSTTVIHKAYSYGYAECTNVNSSSLVFYKTNFYPGRPFDGWKQVITDIATIAQGGTGANNTRDAIDNLGLRVVPYVGSGDDYPDITDLNDLTLTGLFQVAGDFTNAPHANPCFILNVKGTNDRTTQFGWRSKTTTAAKNIYMRRKLDGVWDDWQVVAGPGLAVSNYLPLAGGTLTGQLNIEPTGSTVPLRLKTSSIDVSNFTSNVAQYAIQVMDANASTVGYSQIAKNTSGYVEYRHGAYLTSAYNDSGANKTTYLYARVEKDGSTLTGTNSVFYGAVWNDYAEFRMTVPNIKPGQVVVENGDGSLSISTERLQAGCEVVSDTYGFAIGKTEKAKTPIAVSGRVLVYTYEDRNTFVAGEPVCSGPNGTVSRMTREEAKEYPERIIGTVSEIPEYEVWGEEEVAVNGRIWIRIK